MNLERLTIEEFTSPAPMVIHPKTGVDDVFHLMQQAKVRHLPVQVNGEIVGIVSDRDLRPFLNRNWSICILVEDVMQRSVLSVPETMAMGDAAFLMAKNKVGSLLVVDDRGEVSGIFTTTDALNALVEITLPEAREQLRERDELEAF
ncbi:MAG: CBS domain-containing protein [Bacteriovoracaceae bacterium]|nr:CBS domain-containing protein [Bacteriovoracaceae bacterium]